MNCFIIDRFEGKTAVCENTETLELVDFHMDVLPEGATAGDVLIVDGDAISIDHKATIERKERIQKLFESLWN
ncbi:MAG: DUF3006 domain-containing protein [Clostridiales bacterium]|jgi:hypothetical protein|nr:DUF3006 domain-containing protein [Clostridiales bacterium]